jgi:hypothetical protein
MKEAILIKMAHRIERLEAHAVGLQESLQRRTVVESRLVHLLNGLLVMFERRASEALEHTSGERIALRDAVDLEAELVGIARESLVDARAATADTAKIGDVKARLAEQRARIRVLRLLDAIEPEEKTAAAPDPAVVAGSAG